MQDRPGGCGNREGPGRGGCGIDPGGGGVRWAPPAGDTRPVARKHPGTSAPSPVPIQGEWARIRREWSQRPEVRPAGEPDPEPVGTSERATRGVAHDPAPTHAETEPATGSRPGATPSHPVGRPERRRRAVRTRWWLWAGIGSAAVALVFAVLLVLDLTSSTPAPLRLPQFTGAQSASAAGALSGRWSVTSGSQVGYRVKEVLFGFDHVAVGRTKRVTGAMAVSGDRVVAAEFTARMASVESGVAGRDVAWRDFIMNTGKYPTATFRLTRAIELGALPSTGEVLHEEAVGDLTLRGVTRPIRFPIAGERLASGAIDLQAAIPIRFAEWHIPNPSFAITKVSNSGTMEVLLHLARAARGGRA